MITRENKKKLRNRSVARIFATNWFHIQHLRILSDCDLLAQTQEGREIFYELKIDKMKEIDIWLAQFRKIMEERFQRLDQLLYTIKNKKK